MDGDSRVNGESEALDLPPVLAETVSGIRDDREHGASWLARRAAQALMEATEAQTGDGPDLRLKALRAGARALAEVRPSMAALANTAARIWFDAAERAPGDDPVARLQAIHDSAQHILESWDEAARAITQQTLPLLGPVVCTHSRSGTVEAVLRDHASDPRASAPRRLLIGEGRPGGEGVALARVLAQAGWRVTLFPDAAYSLFIAEAAVVVVGADSVRADGSVVNKVGTYPLALTAREVGVPVFALCETLKIAAPDLPLRFEEMDPRDLLPEPVERIAVHNVYFDRTPPHLVRGIVTERGILKPDDIAPLANEAARALALLLTG